MDELTLKIGNFVAIVYLFVTESHVTKFSNTDIIDFLSINKEDDYIKKIIGFKPYNKIANACKSNINQIIPFNGIINEIPNECFELLKNSKLEYIDSDFYLSFKNLQDKSFFMKWKLLSWINKALYENNKQHNGILKTVIETAINDGFLEKCESGNKSSIRKINKLLDEPDVATTQYSYRDKNGIINTTYCNKKNISFYNIFSQNEQNFFSPEIIINNIKNIFNEIMIVNVLKEYGYVFDFKLLESKILKEFQYDCPLYNSDNNGQFSMF